MITLLVYFVIACAVLGFLYYVIGALIPPPAQKVAYVFLGLVALIVMIFLLLDVVGSAGSLGRGHTLRIGTISTVNTLAA